MDVQSIIANLTKRVEDLELLTENNLRGNAYAQIYETEAASVITVTVAGTYYGWITGAECCSNILVTDIASPTGDRIIVPERGVGMFRAGFNISYRASANDSVHWHIFKNGIIVPNIGTETKVLGVASTVENSCSGLIELVKNDYIDLRVTSSTNGTTITIDHCNFFTHRLK